MKALHTIYTSFAKRLFVSLIALMTIGVCNAWGEEVVAYTFTTAQNSTNSSYASTYDITINGLNWNVPGNQNFDGFMRIGGNQIENVDRVITGKSVISDAITKIVLNHKGLSVGTFKVNSIIVTVASNSDFSTVIDEVTLSNPTLSKDVEGSITFTPNISEWKANSYYKISFNVTYTAKSNNGLNLASIVFYKENTPSTFTVTCQSNNSSYGTISQPSVVTNVANNTAISANGNTLTVGSTKITATPNKPDANYTYAFSNWSGIPDGGKVTENVTVTANFTRTARDLTHYRTSCTTETIVTLDPNGGTISNTDGWTDNGNGTYSKTHEGTEIALPTATKTNYIFGGWYNGETKYESIPSDLVESITLTAKWLDKQDAGIYWDPESVTVTIDADGNILPEFNNPNEIEGITFSSSNSSVVAVDANGVITLGSTGTTATVTITATFDGNETYAAKTVTCSITVHPSNCRWVETDIANINSGDEVVVTMTGYSKGVLTTWALGNDGGTSRVPDAVKVDVCGNAINNVVDKIKWNISSSPEGYVLYPIGSTTTWLYCTKSNNNVKVGDTENNIFTIENGYLKHTNIDWYGYLGINANQEVWGHYTASSPTIANQILKFYKKTCLPADEYWINYNLSNVTCITNPKPISVNSSDSELRIFFEPVDGYQLPKEIEVKMGEQILNEELYTWDNTNGKFVIESKDISFVGDVTISIIACKSMDNPADLRTNVTSTTATLSWSTVENAQNYTLLVISDDDDISYSYETTLLETTCLIEGLTPNTTYLWEVVANGVDGYCDTHTDDTFTTLDVYNVTFNSNGGTAVESQTVDHGSKATKPANPTKTGYTFAGWYTEADTEFDFNTPITSATTLYAKWTEWSYTITYAKGSPADEITGEHAPGIKMYTSALTLAGESFSRPGYKQTGWSKTDGGQKDYNLLGTYGTNEDVTLYPYWTKVHTITWMADGSTHDEATYLDDETLALPESAPEACQGSEFVGWTAEQNYSHATDAPDYITAGSAVNADDTYYAVYAEETEGDEITLAIGAETDNTNGNATYAYAIEVEGFSLVANKGAGQTNPTFNDSYGDARIYAKGSITLTAPKNLTSIVFNLSTQGKKRLAPISASVGAIATQASGDAIVVWTGNASEVTFTVGEKANYGSDGSSNAGQLCFENIVVTSENSYTYYSTSCTPTYRVNYELDGGENGCADEGVKVGNDYTICNDEPTKTGYTFQHWVDENENTYEAGATIENVQSNITLTAVWEANTYTITWMANGEEYIKTSHIYDQPLELPAEPYTCYGAKTFMGWTEASEVNEDGVGTVYIDKETNPSENKTYYAVFADEVIGEPEEVEATLSFADEAQRTSFSSEQQVWEQNGITLTNTQGNGDNDASVANYVNPARFYANSSISIQAPGNITKIVFACSSDSYVTPTKKSVGNSAKSDGNNVIVALSPSSNTFDIAKVTAQIRLNSLTVTYQSTPETTYSNYTTTPSGCPEIEVAENAYVTSTSGQSVKVKVPVTISNYQDGISLSASIEGESNFTIANISSITEGTATLEIAYKPKDYNTTENTTVTVLTKIGENKVTAADFTITGRSLPKKFAMVVEKDGKFYALPANMPEAATYAGYEVEVKDNAIVTTPATYVYSLSAVHNSRYADYGTAVRFVGNDNKCLWASKEKDGTNIRNFAEVANATSDQYEWNLSTTDGERYTISSSAVADAERILRLYNQKFGMYKIGVSEFYFLPLMASTEDAKVLSSAFSVSATEKVQFSAGNLQYHTGDKAWRFAPEQYDYVGDNNANIGEPTFEGWIDMFGWSADGKYGVNTSINNDDYQGEFVDWGTLFPDEWYTLSMNEWYYLLNTRTNAANLKQLAKVGDVYGVLLFPDEWVMPYDVAIPSHDEFNRYSYSLEDWQKLEIAGAVFLPAAGRRAENHQYNTNEYIYYWTSTKETQDKVYYLISCNALGDDQYEYALPQLWHEKGLYGQSVRLARKLMPLQVVEWKENSVVVMYNGDPAQTATVTINNEQKGTTILSDVRKDEAVYELPATGLASSPNQPLEIAIGNAKALMTIPYVATATTTNVVPNNSDLVVLKDATFTATNEQLRNVTVYGGGKLVVGEGATLSTNSLTLRAGGVTADGYDYVYPQFVLNGTWSNTSGKINLDYLTTKEQYYTFVASFAVQTKDIHYPVDIYGNNVAANNTGSFEFQYYDGEARAEGKTGWTVVPEGDDGANLEAGQGYTFLGMPKKVSVNGGSSTRQKFGIHRIPMIVTAAEAIDHENSNQSAPLSVHLADKNNDSGWNLIGNPYMATISGLTNENIQVGKLVHTNDANGNWTGGWHWDEQTVREGQRFLVIPSNDGQSFESTQASNANLPAFKNFFVQIGNKDANALVIPYNKPTNVLAAPARRTEEVDQDIELAIVLEQDEAHSDQLDFLINNAYTAEFDYKADFTKMMNTTNLNLYGVHTDDNLSFLALDNYSAQQSVAIGYQVPAAGEYMLRMSDKAYVMFEHIEALYVTDHEMSPEHTVDIMEEPYTFHVAKAETNNTRFTVSLKLRDSGGGVVTGFENVSTDSEQPLKFFYQDKLYIMRNGLIYDATGKQVHVINE